MEEHRFVRYNHSMKGVFIHYEMDKTSVFFSYPDHRHPDRCALCERIHGLQGSTE